MHKIKFGDLIIENGVAKETNIRMIKQSDVGKCPFFILVVDHYRADGSCKCSNKEHRAMMIKEWEYKKSSFKSIKLVD